MTYTITSHENLATEPIVSDDSRLAYCSVTPGNPRTVTRRAGLLRRRVTETVYWWRCSAGDETGTLAYWEGWASSHQASADASEVMTAWAERYDRRPWVLAERAKRSA